MSMQHKETIQGDLNLLLGDHSFMLTNRRFAADRLGRVSIAGTRISTGHPNPKADDLLIDLMMNPFDRGFLKDLTKLKKLLAKS